MKYMVNLNSIKDVERVVGILAKNNNTCLLSDGVYWSVSAPIKCGRIEFDDATDSIACPESSDQCFIWKNDTPEKLFHVGECDWGGCIMSCKVDKPGYITVAFSIE
jgi:hypothetical protein